MTDILDTGSDYLAHYGVRGMKWGRRKARPIGDFFNNPSAAKALLLGSYGRKSSYTDKKALKKRVIAGRLRIAGWSTTIAGTAISSIAQNPNLSDSAKLGTAYIGQIVGNVGKAALLAGTITGAVAANQEKKSRLLDG